MLTLETFPMRSKLHLVLFTASLVVLPSCIISPPQSPCHFGPVAPAAATNVGATPGVANLGGGGGSLLVEPAALGLPVGFNSSLRSTTRDAAGNPTNQQPTYASSDPTVVTVSPYGQVTPVKPGTATITVTSPGGGTSSVLVTVVAPAVGTATVTPTSLTLNKLGPAPTPLQVSGGKGGTPTFTSSDPKVVTVAPDGTVTAIGNGNATVTVNVDGSTLSVPITVAVAGAPGATPTPTASFSLGVIPSAVGLPVGGKLTLKTTVRDGSGAVVNQPPTYVSSDPTVATVDPSGQVTAIREGVATVTVSVPGASRNVPVTVSKAGDMTVTPASLTINTLGLSPVGLSVSGNKGPITFTSKTPAVVTVGPDGALTAKSNGTSVITVTDGKTSIDVPITVDQEANQATIHGSSDGTTDKDSKDPSDNRNKFTVQQVGETVHVHGQAKDDNDNDVKIKGWKVKPIGGTADGDFTVDNAGLVKFVHHTPGSKSQCRVSAITEGDRETPEAYSLEIDGPGDAESPKSTPSAAPTAGTSPTASTSPQASAAPKEGTAPTPKEGEAEKKSYNTNDNNCR
jgi:hypothetical protein